jgi:Na+-transporting NADH:ubiquinone oxidoreductase subunit C
MQRSVLYTILFATAICIVCAVVVSSSAVSLKERQIENATLEKQKNVLYAAGLLDPRGKANAQMVEKQFETIDMKVIDLETGNEVADVDPLTFDQRREASNSETSHAAPDNPSRIKRLPNRALVYEVKGSGGELEGVVLPIEGYGLWGTLYGFLALESDLDTVLGITYYDHKETPGLGGEVDNLNWKAKWPGRKVFDVDGIPDLTVIKGPAGPPSADPYKVDGLSGATITARGVTNMVHFWLGENGFRPFLNNLAKGETS